MELTTATANLTMGNNLYIRKGADWKVDFTVYDFDCETETKTPKDLSGYTGLMQLRTACDSTEVIATATVDLTRGAEGIITLSMTDAQTAMIPAPGATAKDITSYVYDLEITKGSDNFRILQGRLDVSPDCSR